MLGPPAMRHCNDLSEHHHHDAVDDGTGRAATANKSLIHAIGGAGD